MEMEKALTRLKALQAKLHAYEHAVNILYYDSVTVAPADTDEGRGETLGVLTGEAYALFATPETERLLAFLEERADALTPELRRQTELLRRRYRKMSCIPQEEYVEYQKLVNSAQHVWHRAKEENDFPAFAPYLQRLISMKKRFAELYDSAKDPYDVMLDEY